MIWKLTGNDFTDRIQKTLMSVRDDMELVPSLTEKEKMSIIKHLETCGRLINRHAPKKKKK